MRINKPLTREHIVQALEKGGCVICVFLKGFQSALLENVEPSSVKTLCNYHGWAMAAAVNGKRAAEAFIALLQTAGLAHEPGCYFCAEILDEEKLTLSELSQVLQEGDVFARLEQHRALCFVHGARLASTLPVELGNRILAIAERNRRQLISSLNSFLDQLARDSHAGGGTLGRAAELLFGYRGMSRPEDKC